MSARETKQADGTFITRAELVDRLEGLSVGLHTLIHEFQAADDSARRWKAELCTQRGILVAILRDLHAQDQWLNEWARFSTPQVRSEP